MTNIRFIKNTIITLIIFSIFILCNCAKKPEIFVGLVGNEDLTMNNFTIQSIKASDVFFSVIGKNDFKLSKKHKFALIHYNNKGEKELTLKNIKRLVEVDNASAIILISEDEKTLKEASEYCTKKKTPLFSISGFLTEEDRNKYCFELNNYTEIGPEKIIEYAKDEDNIEKFVMVEYKTDEYRFAEIPSVKKIEEILGENAEIVNKLTLTNNNLFEVIIELESLEDVQGILFVGSIEKLKSFNYKFTEEGLSLDKHIYFLNMMPQSLFTRDELNELLGCTFYSYYSTEHSNPMLETLIETYKTNSGEYPTYAQILTYDILTLVGTAIKNTDSEEKSIISQEIIKMKPIEGSITDIPPEPNSKNPPIYINKIEIDEEAIIPVVKNLKEVE